jgi:hypothetical protein
MRHEGFFCNLDVLYEGPGKSKLQFLKKFFFQFLPFNFWSLKPRSGSGFNEYGSTALCRAGHKVFDCGND